MASAKFRSICLSLNVLKHREKIKNIEYTKFSCQCPRLAKYFRIFTLAAMFYVHLIKDTFGEDFLFFHEIILRWMY